MKFSRLKIPEIIVCESNIYKDDRGYFIESFRKDKLESFVGHKIFFCQENESRSFKGVLRGLHYQLPPHAQTKLVRVVKGAILDVAVDIRKGSPTFGEHISLKLTSDNKKQLFIPRGFAHGFVVLSEEAIVNYKIDNYYHPKSQRGIAFDDKFLGIDWTINKDSILISNQDKNHPNLENAEFFNFRPNLYE